MPNTLAHLGAQGVLCRSLLRDANPRWILLGCTVPDLPWIANRALLFALPAIDAHELRLYVIAQASLLSSLLLCAALAALATRWAPVFLVLSLNATGHLLLDALQTKWGNGVHLLAPWVWQPWNLGLFWPESLPTYLLTALGVVFGLWAVHFSYRHPIRPAWPLPSRAAVFATLLLAYLITPALMSHGPEHADSHSVRTLHDRSDRSGRRVAFDRTWLRVQDDGRRFIVRGDEQIAAHGMTLDHSGRISARGRFLDPENLWIDEIHEHTGFRRDLASYLGLGLVAATWAAAVVPRRRRET
jgi:hypothetical protein